MDPVLTANVLYAAFYQAVGFWVLAALTVPIMNMAWKRTRGR